MQALLALVCVISAPPDVVNKPHQPASQVKQSSGQVKTAQQEVPIVVLPFENLGLYDPLPEYTRHYSDEMFVKWARAQNEMAYRKAQQRADEWAARHPALDIYVQSHDYNSSSTLKQSESASSTGASVDAVSNIGYSGIDMQRTFRDRNRWGGGPVVIINPYVRLR